jgi:hypothetical protein
MEGLRSGGETGYGASPIEFKVQVRTADMEIPYPGQQRGLKETFDSGVTRMYSIFLLSDSISNQKSSFEYRIKSHRSIKLGSQLLFHARPTRGGKFLIRHCGLIVAQCFRENILQCSSEVSCVKL